MFKKRLNVNTSIRPLHLNGKGKRHDPGEDFDDKDHGVCVNWPQKPSIPRHPVIPAEEVFLGMFF